MSLYAEQSLDSYRKAKKMINTSMLPAQIRKYLKEHEKEWYDVLCNKSDVLDMNRRNANDVDHLFDMIGCTPTERADIKAKQIKIQKDARENYRLMGILTKSASHQILCEFDCLVECKLAVDAIRYSVYDLGSEKHLLSWAFEIFVHNGLPRDLMVPID